MGVAVMREVSDESIISAHLTEAAAAGLNRTMHPSIRPCMHNEYVTVLHPIHHACYSSMYYTPWSIMQYHTL